MAIDSDNRNDSTSLVARSFGEFAERYLAGDDSRLDFGVGAPVEP